MNIHVGFIPRLKMWVFSLPFINPGTEVTVREEDGRVVVEPAEDPDAVIERTERLVEETAADGETRPLGDATPVADRETVRRAAEDAPDE